MNLNYYGMSFNPFDKDIATKDAYLTNDMKEMNGRLDFIRNNPGIGVFTAEAGQGKTFSLRYFSERLNPNITKFSYICLSTVTTTEFYRQLCVSLGLDASYRKSIMFKNIQDYFEDMIMGKKIHHIVCLDEAQYLSSEILRDLKMLTNFFMDSRNCFSLLLLGQPTLNSILIRQPHEALRQRIIISYNFRGIQETEAVSYVKNRLTLAGASPAIIDENAILSAFGSCGGSIRKMNLIITKALMIGTQHNKQVIDTDIILAAVNETQLI
jgi:general secretion pathway protein A